MLNWGEGLPMRGEVFRQQNRSSRGALDGDLEMGVSLHIWKDRWIPNLDSFKVISPYVAQSGGEMVSSLLDADKRNWDVVKVRSIFLPHEAEVVLGIRISFEMPADSIFWAWTPNGKFIVKSAYKVAQKMFERRLS